MIPSWFAKIMPPDFPIELTALIRDHYLIMRIESYIQLEDDWEDEVTLTINNFDVAIHYWDTRVWFPSNGDVVEDKWTSIRRDKLQTLHEKFENTVRQQREIMEALADLRDATKEHTNNYSTYGVYRKRKLEEYINY
jgi:hypothetical protein